MRILIDTNILISAILGNGTPFQAYVKAVSYPNSGVVCTQNIDELRRIFNRKFPKKISAMEQFLAMALSVIEVVQVPDELTEEEQPTGTLSFMLDYLIAEGKQIDYEELDIEVFDTDYGMFKE